MQAVLGQGDCAADSSERLRLFLGLEAEEGGLGRRKVSQPEQQLCQMLEEGSQGCKAQLEFRGRGARRSQTSRTPASRGNIWSLQWSPRFPGPPGLWMDARVLPNSAVWSESHCF